MPVRLSEGERGQIAGAAAHPELTLSGFIRQAALQSATVVTGKASVVRERRPLPERADVAPRLLVVEPGQSRHWVDGEPVPG